MCGVAGFVGAGDQSVIADMVSALSHRGPDESDTYCSAPVFLGHSRLSIIDIRDGHQPMWNLPPDQGGQVAVVFNGEIYNHLELREELKNRGHRFLTDHSDTEVLIHGYKEWGADLPSHLNGMFAFAIYDRRRREFFLARDRFGEKPLFYIHSEKGFAFASEARALLRYPQASTRLNNKAVQKFFAYGFIPSPLSLYEGMSKIPPGGFVVYDIDGGGLTEGLYWKFSLKPDVTLERAGVDAVAEELTGLLRQATKRRMIADVPLGIFLSGGIDSSSILACMSELTAADQIKSFTIGFAEPSYNESENARRVAEYFGTDHHERQVSMGDMMERLPSILERMGEPIADPSLLPTHLLSAFTREKVTVALSGDGGDELFAGYDPFKALKPAVWYDRVIPRPLHEVVRHLAEGLPKSNRNMSFDFKVRRFLQGMSYDHPMWNPVWLSPLEPRLFGDVFGSPLSPEELYSEAISIWNGSGEQGSIMDRTLEFYTRLYLCENILTKVDRAAMFCSLETRAVFLDPELVAFAERIPTAFKYNRGTGKYILKKALSRMLPDEVLNRRKKGFGIPLYDWLKNWKTPPSFSSQKTFNHDVIKKMWESHCQGKQDHRLFMFACLALDSALQGAKDRGL